MPEQKIFDIDQVNALMSFSAEIATENEIRGFFQSVLDRHGWRPILKALEFVAVKDCSWSIYEAAHALLVLHSVGSSSRDPSPAKTNLTGSESE